MADITIEAATNLDLGYRTVRLGPVWVDVDTAYVFYTNAAYVMVYRKTTNGGVSWGAAVVVGGHVGATDFSSIWFDKWTPGDVGTKIHIAYGDENVDNVLYRNLDTATDTLSAEVIIFDGVSLLDGNWSASLLDITKARGGNLYCGFWLDNAAENGFYRSTDGGATWAARTTMADGVQVDLILLEPGDEADTNDIWCIYWDQSTYEISLKVYDNSANSWAETAIVGDMIGSTAYYQMSASTRASDNHVILAAWNRLNQAQADLKVWNIGGTGSIVAKANVLTNTAEAAQCAVFINQQTDDIYVAYLKGTDWTTLVGAFYKKSADGGANWGAETPLSADVEDDQRGIWAGHSVGDDGGYFMPAWFNDDLDDLLTNIANAVAIAAAGGPPQTLTPDPVALPFSVPSPTLSLGTATITPSPVAIVTDVPLVTVSSTVTLAPDPVAMPFVVAEPSLAMGAVVLTPDPVTIPFAIPNQIIVGSGAIVLLADPILMPLVVAEPTLTVGAVTLTPSPVATVFVVPASQIVAVCTLTPAPVTIPFVVPDPGIGVGICVITPSPVVATWVIPTQILIVVPPAGVSFAQFGELTRLIGPSDFPATALFYFEAIIKTSSPVKVARARLYNVTDGIAVVGSEVTTTSTTAQRLRSTALTLASGAKEYRTEFGGVAGGLYTCYAADVIVDSG